MEPSDVGEGSGDGPASQSSQGPTGVNRSSQTGGIPPVGAKENPIHIDYPEASGQEAQPGSTEPPPPVRGMMQVTLLIPEDEYKVWSSSLAGFVQIRKTKILNKADRDRLGLE
jgi:hypothetical protein